ncbi:unnamed protein product [Musa acuminata subsp. burmannicoides]|uniref:(wild Malaysian banana) hypothetical protein n=1 Tax=Musa acuminata subsp. malaccensis TaxID=214687 RepID=A0A804J4Q6_MUSAM|nr:unnamed protein product [Musa acuminata subsp. malaccensis]
MKVGFEQVYSLLVWGWCTPYSVAIFHRRQCCQLDSSVLATSKDHEVSGTWIHWLVCVLQPTLQGKA